VVVKCHIVGGFYRGAGFCQGNKVHVHITVEGAIYGILRIVSSHARNENGLHKISSISLIVSPYHVVVKNHGVEAGPAVIRDLAIPVLKRFNVPTKVVEIESVDNFGRGRSGAVSS
jgi:hypothetical protein